MLRKPAYFCLQNVIGKPPGHRKMTTIIPADINDRLLYFDNEVKKYFSFLSDFDYSLEDIKVGQSENFLDFFSHIKFKNGKTSISIHFSTDTIKGATTAFPKTKQRPNADSQVSCFISDDKAFMSVYNLIETKYPTLQPSDNFTIPLISKDVKAEITRVIINYSNFFRDKLTQVLKKEKMYDCYTDRFFDKVFKEINYVDK
jgi:hypothetical protein